MVQHVNEVAELLLELHQRGVELRPGPEGDDVIHYRPAERVDDELLARIRAYKPSLNAALRAAQAREDAVDAAWERLRLEYLASGAPGAVGWLTSDVLCAEDVVSKLWVSARADPQDDTLFHEHLQRWERLMSAAMRGAVGGQ